MLIRPVLVLCLKLTAIVVFLMPLDEKSAVVGYRTEMNQALAYIAYMDGEQNVTFLELADVCFEHEKLEMNYHGVIVNTDWFDFIRTRLTLGTRVVKLLFSPIPPATMSRFWCMMARNGRCRNWTNSIAPNYLLRWMT
jgi:hypothetical protein